jgi:ABC-type sulfate transport system permease subunit
MDMSEVWLRVGLAVVPPASSSLFTMDLTVPFIGVPVNVVVGACAGAISGFAFAQPEESRKKLFQTAMVSVVFACSVVALAEGVTRYWFHWDVESKYLAALAVLLSLLGRFIVPAVIERLPGWLDKLPFTRSSKTPEGD